MISSENLIKLVSDYATIFKKNAYVKDGVIIFRERINFHPTYLKSVDYRDRIVIHSEVGDFPARLFEVKAPNMSPDEFGYLKANYKQNTLPVYSDYYATISRAWADGNWSVNYVKDEQADSLQAYLTYNVKHFDSIENYFKSLITHLASIDPNAVVAVKVDDMATVTDVEGNVIIDETKLPEPQPVFYRCDQVIYRMMGKEYMILTDEHSPVEYGGGTKNIGFVMEFYDDTHIYRITQIGKLLDWQFEITVIFTHNYGKVPVTELKGIPQLVQQTILWISPFLYACDNLDLALTNKQMLQVSKTTTCFPYRIMIGSTCTFEETYGDMNEVIKCRDGWLNYPNQTRIKCKGCHGSGLEDRVSQFGMMLLSPEDWSSTGEGALAGKAMSYVSPETSALEFVESGIDKDIDSARKILHLQSSNSNVKGSENLTATGMSLDEKTQYSFNKPISDRLFAAFEYTINTMGFFRYGTKYDLIKPEIVYPSTFDFKTESEYLEQIAKAQRDGMPPAMIQQLYLRFFQTHYFYEKRTNEVFRLVMDADRLMVMSKADIINGLNKGTVKKEEAVLHDSAVFLIDQILLEDEAFFEKDLKDQIIELTLRAKTLSDSIKSSNETTQSQLKKDLLGG